MRNLDAIFLVSILTFVCRDGGGNPDVTGLLFDEIGGSGSNDSIFSENLGQRSFSFQVSSGETEVNQVRFRRRDEAHQPNNNNNSNNNSNNNNTIRRRQHRHKPWDSRQNQVGRRSEVDHRQSSLGRQDGDGKFHGHVSNYVRQHPSDQAVDVTTSNSVTDVGEDHRRSQIERERKERMKKYWEKKRQFYEEKKKKKKLEEERKSGSVDGKQQQQQQRSNDAANSPEVSLQKQQQQGMEMGKNSVIMPDGANARKWRHSEAKIHNVHHHHREHLKRQIYKAGDDGDDDEEDGGDGGDSSHHHQRHPNHLHHHHHNGNHRNGLDKERRCDKKLCRNDGICNYNYNNINDDEEEPTRSNVTSHKKCLCRLGTSGQYCEKTEVTVKYPKFRGLGFIAFPAMRNSYMEFSIRLEFRPEVNSGLLLFSSDHVDASHDFFSINLIDGKIEFRFDCGTGLGRIRTEEEVTLGSWNSLEVSRKEAEAEIRLNKGPFLRGRSKGDYTKMTFRDHLFLGGHRNMTHAARYSGARAGFVGCIRRLEVNDRKYDMRRGAFVGDALYGLDVEECDGHECERVRCHNGGTCINREVDSYVCLCRLGNVGKNCERKADVTMPSFGDLSYLQYVGLRRTVLNFLQMEMVFLPRTPTGMLVFNGFSPDGFGDFVSLALVNSTVEFRFDLGTGPAVIRGRNPVTLNEWHSLKAWRDGKNGHLQVDGDMEVTGTSRGAFTQLTLALDLFVGGHRNFDEVTRNAFVSSSFNGCIQKLVINERPIKLIHESLGGVNVGECSAHPCSSKHPCLNGGKCIAIMDKYKCDCLPGFLDDHCQRTSRYRFRYKRSPEGHEVNPIPKFTGSSYMLFTRHDVVSKTRGNSFDLEMRIKFERGNNNNKNNNYGDGLIFFMSNQIDQPLPPPPPPPPPPARKNAAKTSEATTDYNGTPSHKPPQPSSSPLPPITTTTTTATATTITTSSMTYGNFSDLFNDGTFLESSDGDGDVIMTGDDDVRDRTRQTSIVNDDDGGYEDDDDDGDDDDDDDYNPIDDFGVITASDESLHVKSGGDFFVVGVIDGSVTVEFSLGDGIGKMTFNESKVSDGDWHSIRLHRRGKEATLEVDGSDVIKATCPGNSEQFFTDGNVYIGGLPDVEQRTSGRYTSGFSGCIGHISLSSGQPMDLFKMADVASDVSTCQDV